VGRDSSCAGLKSRCPTMPIKWPPCEVATLICRQALKVAMEHAKRAARNCASDFPILRRHHRLLRASRGTPTFTLAVVRGKGSGLQLSA